MLSFYSIGAGDFDVTFGLQCPPTEYKGIVSRFLTEMHLSKMMGLM